MDISISDKRLHKVANDPAACQREYGLNMAKKIALRLAALYAGLAGGFLATEVGAGKMS
jgi:hypothetical protein